MSRDAAGFSLIEILAAFLVVGLMLGAALPLIGQGLRGSAAAERRTIALMHAESRLAEISVLADARGETGQGDLPGGFRWRAETIPLQPLGSSSRSGPSQRMLLHRVAVTWTGARPGEEVTLSTLQLRPVETP